MEPPHQYRPLREKSWHKQCAAQHTLRSERRGERTTWKPPKARYSRRRSTGSQWRCWLLAGMRDRMG
eukprot:1585921-Pleurochrysis_carterae.AAC.1